MHIGGLVMGFCVTVGEMRWPRDASIKTGLKWLSLSGLLHYQGLKAAYSALKHVPWPQALCGGVLEDDE